MGFMDSIKDAFGGSSKDGSVDDVIQEIDEEIEEEDEEVLDVEVEEEPEPEPEEWDSAYDFATEMLEYRGFSSGQDFVAKVMFDEASKSPMYRDRIASGTRTMSQIADAKSKLQEVRGGSGGTDLGDMADKVEDANRVIKSVESLEGKEEQMYQEIIGVAQQGVNALVENKSRRGGVESTVEEVNEDL